MTEYESIPAASRRTGISAAVLRRCVDEGSLAAVRLGPRTVRLWPPDVDAFLAPASRPANAPDALMECLGRIATALERIAAQAEARTDDKIMTGEDVACALGVSNATLAAWAKRGEGPPRYQIGGAARYRATEVQAFIKAGSFS